MNTEAPQVGTYDYYMALSARWASKAEKNSKYPKLAKADLAMSIYNYNLAQEARTFISWD